MAKQHPMSYFPLFAGALAAASAREVIVDPSDPYSGIIQVSQRPLTDVRKAVSLDDYPWASNARRASGAPRLADDPAASHCRQR
jgi:hypothetical protein